MKKYLSICCVVLLIISALSITAERLSIHADVTDTYVTLDKTATDYEITCGQEILMNLTVNGTGVGGPLDIMLVIDRSSSMQGQPLDAAKAAAKSFIDNRSFTGDPATSDWVGISSYATTASLDQGLTDDSTLAKSAINGLSAGLSSRGYTNIMAGVHVAQEELATNGRNHAMDIIIVLSDGVANRWTDFITGTTYKTVPWPTTHTTSTLKAIDEATAAKNAGTIVFTIGLNLVALGASQGVARDTLEQMATSLDYFFDAATPGYLEEIYGRIATYITPAATNLTLTDVVEDEFVIVGGSTDPPATSVMGNTITWEFDTLGSETKTFQYKIRPIRGLEGWYPTNVEANLTYTDPEGNPASQTFPNPLVYLYRVCTPAIQIIKTANPTVINKGEKVVYTYEVTNLGPYPLHDVNVTDDQYGIILFDGTISFDLDVGETKILTYEAYPNATVTNVATAKGKDPWNYTVSDEDDAIVSVIAECPVTFFTDPTTIGNITFLDITYFNGDSENFTYGTYGWAEAHCPPGYVFDHWIAVGNLILSSTTDNPTNFTIVCGGNLTAVFKQIQCPVTFYTDPVGSGFNITFEGDIYFDGDTDTFTYGTSGLATANVPEGWVFDHWEATGNVDLSSTTTNPTTVSVLCGGTLKAVFRQVECPVTFYTDPSTIGSITFKGDIHFNEDSNTFPYGTSGLATANVPDGWMFDHWVATGNVELSNTTTNPTTVTVVCGGTLRAVFIQIECTVNFYTDPVGSNFNITFEGETYVNGDSDTFPYGTSGSAYADCPPGWVFDHWETVGNVALDPDEYANPVTFTITCGGDLKAVYVQVQCPVTFYTDPSTIGSITFEGDIYFDSDADSFPYGTSGLATANVPAGWMFDRWEATGYVDLSSTTENPTTVTVLCGGTLKAVFIEEQGTGDFGTIGYWKHVFWVWKTGKGTFKDYVEEILVDYLERINAKSTVFNENYTLTLESAYDLLWSKGSNMSNMRTKALRQCLACWLNWADGAVTMVPPQMVDTDGDKVPDMTFSEAMTIVENILRNPHSSREELEQAKNICDSINNM